MSFGIIPWAVGIVIFLSGPGAQAKPSRPSALDWAPLERVLETFVDDRGLVRYSALKLHRADLDRAIAEIERLSPLNAPELFPTRQARLAYWINAYNAWVLRLVVDHYPTSSITRIGPIPFGAFFITRVDVGGKKMTLRALENDILRGDFQDARIHFAINCASRSCPPLARHVYRAETLEEQLDQAARAFINDDHQVTLNPAERRIVVSKLFDWYASDFRASVAEKSHGQGTVLDYLAAYLTPQRRQALEKLAAARVSYHEYDWGLNDQDAGQAVR